MTLWTPEEDARLRHLFEVERKTKRQIAALMPGRTFPAIQFRTLDLGLKWQGPLNGWSVEQDKLVRQLWVVEKLPASQIGRRMNRSRSAIIGYVTRHGLSRELSPDDVKARKSSPRFVKPDTECPPSRPRNMLRFGNVSIPKSVVPACKMAPERLTATAVTLAERRPDQCGWPVNDGNPFLFCGTARCGHRRYCDHHAQLGVSRGRVA